MERKRASNRKRNLAAIDVGGGVSASDKSVNNLTGVDSTETAAVSRRPLSNLINIDNVPTQTLRQLCSNSEAQSLLRKTRSRSSHFPQSPQNSTTHIASDSDSKSATSIGSSNFNPAPSSRPGNPTPVRRHYPPTGNKGLTSGHRDDGVPARASTIAEKLKNQENEAPVPTPYGKVRDKGKGVAPLDSTPTRRNAKETPTLISYERAKDKGKGIAVSFDSTPTRNAKETPTLVAYERAKNNGKGIAAPFDSTPTRNAKETPTLVSYERAKNKGKGIAVPFDSTPTESVTETPNIISYERGKDKGKGIAIPFDSTPTEHLSGKGKGISLGFKPSSVEKIGDKGKAICESFNATLGEKRKDKGKAVAHGELEDAGKSTPVRMNLRSSKRSQEHGKADAIVHSCPRLPGTRNTRSELSEDEEVITSKSWTDPRPKAKKRKKSASESSLPVEFVKQQKAYFDEVDAFELPVEEVSGDDLD